MGKSLARCGAAVAMLWLISAVVADAGHPSAQGMKFTTTALPATKSEIQNHNIRTQIAQLKKEINRAEIEAAEIEQLKSRK